MIDTIEEEEEEEKKTHSKPKIKKASIDEIISQVVESVSFAELIVDSKTEAYKLVQGALTSFSKKNQEVLILSQKTGVC